MLGLIANGFVSAFRFFFGTKFISFILGFFTSTGPFISFFIWIGKKLSFKAIILPVQWASVGALFVAKVASLTVVISLISYIYNEFHTILDTLSTVFQGNVYLDTAYKVLQSIGFIDALYSSFTNFSFVWFSVLILVVSKYIFNSLKLLSDELFKIGLLVGE